MEALAPVRPLPAIPVKTKPTMRKLLTALFTLACAAGAIAEDAPKSSYSITTDFSFFSEYFFRGVKNQSAALQPSASLTAGSFSAGIWTSQAVEARSASWAQGNEIDFWGAYAVPMGKYSLNLGGTYYLYPSARESLGEPDATWEGSVGVSGPLGPLTGSATYFHDFVLDSNTVELKIGYSMALPQEKGSFDLGFYYGMTDISDGNGDIAGDGGVKYDYYGINATLTYKLTTSAALKLGVYWTDVSDDIPSQDDNVFFSIGVTTGL